jgi:hypothetical protein
VSLYIVKAIEKPKSPSGQQPEEQFGEEHDPPCFLGVEVNRDVVGVIAAMVQIAALPPCRFLAPKR